MSDFGSGKSDVVRGPRASFGLRLVAAIIDGVVLFIVGFVLGLVLGRAFGTVLQILVGLGYFTYLEGSPAGQTVGKKAMNIRVIDFSGGGPIGFSRALVRYLGHYVSFLACLLGYFWMLWDSEKQTWHDKFAGAVVVPTSAYPVAAWPG